MASLPAAPPPPGGPPYGLQLASAGATEPKGALNHFCQRYCKRPVTKEDIVYTSAKYGKVYQVTVTLNCMDGQQFVGETASTLKDAEKNAAHQALIHLEPLSGSLPATSSKNKKRKAVAVPQPAMGLGLEQSVPKAMKTGAGVAETSAGWPVPVGAQTTPATGSPVSASTPAAWPTASGASGTSGAASGTSGAFGTPTNPALTCKVVLNTVCMKLLKRPMQKGEVVYETCQTPIGFQSTVRLPCLPGDWGELAWAGEVAQQQKQAEQNAAKEALEAVNANTDTIKSLLPTAPSKTAAGGKCGGWPGGGWTDGKGRFCGGPKAKGKGWGSSYWPSKGGGALGTMAMGNGGLGGFGIGGGRGCMGGWGGELEAAHDVEPQDSYGAAGQGFGPRRSQQRALPRKRISEVAITGEVIEWKGKYGWLQPHAEIAHPMAQQRGGKVFASHNDVVPGFTPTEGAVIQFHVYEDPTGLGAEEVALF